MNTYTYTDNHVHTHTSTHNTQSGSETKHLAGIQAGGEGHKPGLGGSRRRGIPPGLRRSRRSRCRSRCQKSQTVVRGLHCERNRTPNRNRPSLKTPPPTHRRRRRRRRRRKPLRCRCRCRCRCFRFPRLRVRLHLRCSLRRRLLLPTNHRRDHRLRRQVRDPTRRREQGRLHSDSATGEHPRATPSTRHHKTNAQNVCGREQDAQHSAAAGRRFTTHTVAGLHPSRLVQRFGAKTPLDRYKTIRHVAATAWHIHTRTRHCHGQQRRQRTAATAGPHPTPVPSAGTAQRRRVAAAPRQLSHAACRRPTARTHTARSNGTAPPQPGTGTAHDPTQTSVQRRRARSAAVRDGCPCRSGGAAGVPAGTGMWSPDAAAAAPQHPPKHAPHCRKHALTAAVLVKTVTARRAGGCSRGTRDSDTHRLHHGQDEPRRPPQHLRLTRQTACCRAGGAAVTSQNLRV